MYPSPRVVIDSYKALPPNIPSATLDPAQMTYPPSQPSGINAMQYVYTPQTRQKKSNQALLLSTIARPPPKA